MFGRGVLALALGLVWAIGATGGRQPAPDPSLVLLLASDQPAYGQGATATFTIAVDNPGSAPAALTFPSAQVYDVVVLAGETEVWRWSADRMFAAVVTERSYPPGLTLLGRESWNWRDAAGAPLPPGTYRVVASLATNPPRPGNVLEIELRAP